MEDENLSAVTEFIFTGFARFQDGGLLYFVRLLFIYTFIIVGNLLIFAVRPDTCLHNLMYNPISIFTFLEMCSTTYAIPKMLSNLTSSQKTISFIGCLLQMYFFHPFGNTEGALLTVMSIDRIIIGILGIRSAEGCKKAFSTCAAHISIFLLFFGSVALMYLRFFATPFWDTTIAPTFSVLAPFSNTIIYSLRNKDMKDAINKLLCPPKGV